jgi:hypothetical protein
MTANQFRSHVLTVCLATMLLPTEAVVAQSLITPRSDFDVPAFWDLPSVSPAAAKTDTLIEPWLRNTFVRFRAEGTPPTEPTDLTPSTAEPAQAPAAAPAVPAPGTVQNLRRADKR